jgi:hypothetical protein
MQRASCFVGAYQVLAPDVQVTQQHLHGQRLNKARCAVNHSEC